VCGKLGSVQQDEESLDFGMKALKKGLERGKPLWEDLSFEEVQYLVGEGTWCCQRLFLGSICMQTETEASIRSEL
jgi:hypothetical protein